MAASASDSEQRARSMSVNVKDILKFSLSAHDRDRILDDVGTFELLDVAEDLNIELATVQAENHLLTSFLRKVDPKLLVGLRGKPLPVVSAQHSRRSSKSSMGSNVLVKKSQSMASTMSRRRQEYTTVNSKAKSEIIDMLAIELEKSMLEQEASAEHDLKSANAQIAELKRRCEDDKETEDNYLLHFGQQELELICGEGTPEVKVSKFRKFITHWLKTADGMLDNINLSISNLGDRCHRLRRDIIVKADMSQFVTEIEFERLIIFRDGLINITKDQNMQALGLKTTAHRTSFTLATLSKEFENLKKVKADMTARTMEIKRKLLRIEKEIKATEKCNDKDNSKLLEMTARCNEYQAPSIEEYMNLKVEQVQLQKEENVLARKIAILHMKFKNVQTKLTQRRDT